MKYLIGSSVRLGVAFRVARVFTDPSTVMLVLKQPSGEIETLHYPDDTEITRLATGRYYADITLDDDGELMWRWVGTGAAVAAVEGTLTVMPSIIT